VPAEVGSSGWNQSDALAPAKVGENTILGYQALSWVADTQMTCVLSLRSYSNCLKILMRRFLSAGVPAARMLQKVKLFWLIISLITYT
jgi:hypothetical protein